MLGQTTMRRHSAIGTTPRHAGMIMRDTSDMTRTISANVTADRRSVGTDIAAMPEEGSGILSSDAVERRSECLLQRLDGACGDPAEVGFHLGPAGFDRAQVGAVAGQIAIGKA